MKEKEIRLLGKPYVLTTTLSKAGLGRALYHLLKHGFDVYQVWAFNARYERSAVEILVVGSPHMRQHFEAETGLLMAPAPKAKLNSESDRT